MTISNRHKKYKRSGSILASVMVAAIVWIMIAQSMFITFSGQFKMISSSRTALQAQQYAEIALDKLKNINYDELDASGAHGRKKIEGISSDDWQDEVTIGSESTIAGSDDAKQRIATVNVYKVGDTLPRYTVEVPLSSQGSSNNSIGFPDYNRRIKQQPGITHTANENGYIEVCIATSSTQAYIYINGILRSIPLESKTFGESVSNHAYVVIPISKDDQYLIKHSVSSYNESHISLYWIPCK